MSTLSRRNRALFETTKRLLSQIVNEGLSCATIKRCESPTQQLLCLQNRLSPTAEDGKWVTVGLQPCTRIEEQGDQVVSLVRPDSLQPPVFIGDTMIEREELDPGIILRFIRSWLVDDASETMLEQIAQELQNSADNQEKWLDISATQKCLSLNDNSVAWEKSLIYGHPSHPFHRLCYAQAPLKPVNPDDIPRMLTPTLSFVSVPHTDLRFSGPFEQVLQPLLERFDIPKPTSDRAVVPCLAQQLPSVMLRFPNAIVLKSIEECADAQASMRTITLRPELEFGYHLKLSLACQITSALRTITPWTTCGGPIFTELLEGLLPPDLWVFREVAAVTGSQVDFSDARHLSCILREDPEARARENNEALIISATFAQQPPSTNRTYAEILFGLETISQKRQWFRRYIACLFGLLLPPLVNHGIGLESHGQNLVARICRRTAEIKGFIVRDFGGVRLHVPTLHSQGIKFDSMPTGGATMTDDLQDVRNKVHHALLQNHVGTLLSSLGLESHGGWAIVREELSLILKPAEDTPGGNLYNYFVKDTMPFKCFLRMRMEGKYRDASICHKNTTSGIANINLDPVQYVERELPNVLLMDSNRWESMLHTYQPSLHRT